MSDNSDRDPATLLDDDEEDDDEGCCGEFK